MSCSLLRRCAASTRSQVSAEQDCRPPATIRAVELLCGFEVSLHAAAEGVELVGSDRFAGDRAAQQSQPAQGKGLSEQMVWIGHISIARAQVLQR